MGKLVVTSNGKVEGEYPLSEERIIIGRHPESDICIDDVAVSGRHALIVNILEDSFLEDLGSTNGVYVNGELTKKCVLAHGDVINIGSHLIRYENTGGSVARSTARETPTQLGAARSVGPDLTVTSMIDREADSAVPIRRIARLKVLTGPATGNRLTLDQEKVTLGKPGMQVATICRQGEDYLLTHVESKDGEHYPRVNNEPAGPEAYRLKDHDVIELVGVEMEFTYDD